MHLLILCFCFEVELCFLLSEMLCSLELLDYYLVILFSFLSPCLSPQPLSLSLSLSLSVSLFLSLSLSPTSYSPSHALAVSVYLLLYLSLSIPLCISTHSFFTLSISFSMFACITFSLSLSLSLSSLFPSPPPPSISLSHLHLPIFTNLLHPRLIQWSCLIACRRLYFGSFWGRRGLVNSTPHSWTVGPWGTPSVQLHISAWDCIFPFLFFLISLWGPSCWFSLSLSVPLHTMLMGAPCYFVFPISCLSLFSLQNQRGVTSVLWFVSKFPSYTPNMYFNLCLLVLFLINFCFSRPTTLYIFFSRPFNSYMYITNLSLLLLLFFWYEFYFIFHLSSLPLNFFGWYHRCTDTAIIVVSVWCTHPILLRAISV